MFLQLLEQFVDLPVQFMALLFVQNGIQFRIMGCFNQYRLMTGEGGKRSELCRPCLQLNAEKDTVYSSLVDFYSKYPEKAIRIITPKMPKANYTLQVEITGVRPVWTDKTKTIYGSDGTFVTIDNVYHF